MPTLDQKKEYDDLKEDVREYNRYLRVGLWIARLAIFPEIAAIVFFVVSILAPQTIEIRLTFLLTIVLVLCAIGILLIGAFIKILGQRKSPSADKLTRFYTYAIIDNLDNYFDPERADTLQLKKQFRKKAIENAHDLLSIIEQNWIIGDFKLGEKLRKLVSEFKELVSTRLVRNIEEGDPETYLRKANYVMSQISLFFDHPSIENLERINKEMSDGLAKPKERGYLTRFLNFLRSHSSAKHIIGMTLITLSSMFIYMLARYHFMASDWDSFSLSAECWAMLIAGYFVFMVAEKIRKES
jgi:hypothetical protein